MLTAHQKFHLRAVITKAISNKARSQELKSRLAFTKEIPIRDYDQYLDNIKDKAQLILNSGVFPAELDTEEPSDIHDFLEKGHIRNG